MTDSYELRVKESAKKELRRIARGDLRRIAVRIEALASNPRPNGCEKLAGGPGHRVRQGDYRIIYTIDDERRIVEIVKIGHRREVYR